MAAILLSFLTVFFRRFELPFDETASSSAPNAFGAYRVLHQIGSGVLGPVFRAHEPGRDRLIAIKAFKLDLLPEDVARLAAQLRRLAATPPSHPLIVPYVDAGLEGTTPFLASEYALGDTLDVVMRQVAPAPLDRAIAILRPLAEAVDAASAAGLGHGALHPRDVFVDLATKTVRHVTGFGIIPALESVGVPAPARRPYAAPERAAGQRWDARADVYAVGAIAHELLTGRRPAGPGEQNGVFSPDLTPEQRVDARRVLAAALAADPADRYGSAADLVAALDAVARGDEPPLPAHVETPVERPSEPAVVPAATLFDLQGESDRLPTIEAADVLLTGPIGDATIADQPLIVSPETPALDDDTVVPPPPAEEDADADAVASPPAIGEVAPILVGPVPELDELPVGPEPLPPRRVIADAPIALVPRRELDALPVPVEPIVVTRFAWGPVGMAAAACLVIGALGGYFLGAWRSQPVEPTQPAASSAARADTEVAVAPGSTTPAQPATAVPDPPSPVSPAARDVQRAVAASGRLIVRSVPSGAMVTIDGRVSGETPLTVRDLALGPHTLQVARPGHAPRSERVTLTAAAPARTLTFELEAGVRSLAAYGSIDVDSRPRGARVTIDGRHVGSTPLRAPELSPGAHVVTIELDGYGTVVSRTTVEAGRTATVRVTLERKAGVAPATLPPTGGR